MAKILDGNEMFPQLLQYKTKNSFVMYIENIPTSLIKMANRPSISFETIVVDHINVKRKYQGKGDWSDLTINLYDPIVPSGAQTIIEWIRLSHESWTGRRGYADMYKKDITLALLGPVGDFVEEWQIKGAFITQAGFGDLDWSSGADITGIDVTLAYDYALLVY